jgi:hypothetical protein
MNELLPVLIRESEYVVRMKFRGFADESRLAEAGHYQRSEQHQSQPSEMKGTETNEEQVGGLCKEFGIH